MASAGELSGLIHDPLDIDVLETDMASPKLPGAVAASQPRAQGDRYLAPTDEKIVPGSALASKGRAPVLGSTGPGLATARAGVAVPEGPKRRSFYRELNEDFAEDHKRLIFGVDGDVNNLLDQELEEVYPCIINPERWPKELFNFLQAFLLIYIAIFVPYRIGFDIDLPVFSASWWWEAAVNVYFAIDLVLSFYTGYYDADDMLEMRKSKIANHYMKFWFWIDVVSCFPMDYVQLMFDESSGAANLKLLKVLRIAV